MTLEPFAKEIIRLYQEEHATTREIGARFGASKHPVLDLLKRHNIARRKSRSPGRKATEAELRQWILVDHLSLVEIAQIVGCDGSAVTYWLREYNIPWEGNTWGQRNAKRNIVEVPAEQLRDMYETKGMSFQNIANECGTSTEWVRLRIQRYGIPVRSGGWQGKRFLCADNHLVKSTYELRVDDWLFSNGIGHEYEMPIGFGGSSTADFLTDTGVFIEVWGVAVNAVYQERRARKIAWYQSQCASLISINYWDFDASRNSLWIRKLSGALCP